MGAAFSSNTKKYPLIVEPSPKSTTNKVAPLTMTQTNLMIPQLSARSHQEVTLGNNQQTSKNSARSAPATTAASKRVKDQTHNKKNVTQLLENEVVNIIYVERGSKPPTKVQELVQQDKFVVVPKVHMAPTFMRGEFSDQRILRVVRPSQEQLEQKGTKKIFFVG